jgi:hypothetical protein
MHRMKRLERPSIRVAHPSEATRSEGVHDAPLLRLGAVLGVLGVVLQVVMDRLHPHHVDPNHSAKVFHEYARSHSWTIVHLGQFVGTFLIVLALVSLACALSRQPGLAGALGFVGGVAAVTVGAVFAVQMAVDGVALKAAIDAWVGAAPGDQSNAFQVAEGVRWLEKGLSGIFQVLNGTTLLTLGLSIAGGRSYPRWLGVVGALAGVGFVVGGTSTLHSGFSATSGVFLLPASLLLAVFLLGVVTLMWRRSRVR